MAEVTAQPGFRWSRRVRLDQDADDGWHAYMMIYGLESRDALLRYFESDAPKQYAVERKPFEQHLRTERDWGAIDFQRRLSAGQDRHDRAHRSRALGQPAREILQHRAAA